MYEVNNYSKKITEYSKMISENSYLKLIIENNTNQLNNITGYSIDVLKDKYIELLLLLCLDKKIVYDILNRIVYQQEENSISQELSKYVKILESGNSFNFIDI